MSLILNDQQVNNAIETAIVYYKVIFNEDLSNVNIYPSDDINEDTKLFINIEEELPPQPNARFIEPNPISKTSTILIRYNEFYENGYSFISTIIHELTHFSDYKKYCDEYCNKSWLNIRKQPDFDVMYYWSEYHARITQIIHMRIFASIISNEKDILEKQSIKEEFTKYQLPIYKNILVEALNTYEDTFDLIDIFNYCARFFVCQSYNNELKIEDHIPECVFKYFPDIIKLYYDLYSMQSYEQASKKFSYLSLMLNNFL